MQRHLAVNNHSKLPYFDADFGSGPPVFYALPLVPIPYFAVLFPTSEADGSIDLRIVLPRELKKRFDSEPWQARLRGRLADSPCFDPGCSIGA